ncbi:sodium:solute symporter [Thermaurantimonas aggregans]|uniref:Sodium:solute symporter n=1 Tax=Thermaurantimonas aggregans TaxID=2173829 RepID=A0A401XJ68_9FLAO|nr:sodium:solute symporter family protein [Thermaurantimonas aggregans]GCD77069.1 sodium:solute symporter [Thermaurantimonas aggregans]
MVIATSIFLALWAGIVLYFTVISRKSTGSIRDYALGSMMFSPVFVGLSLAAGMTSAATFIINPGLIGYYGISGVISYAISLPLAALISLVILTRRFRKAGSSTKALSLAQWMGHMYQCRAVSTLFAVLSLLLITFLVLITVGLTKVLTSALKVDYRYVLLGITVFVFGYMAFGGANTMVYSNAIQAVLMLVVAITLLGSGWSYFSEGFSGFFAKLKSIDPRLVQPTNPESPLFRDYFEIVVAQMIVGVAIICQPHIITKSLLLKSERQVKPYLVSGVVVQTLFFLVVIAGLYARIEFPDLSLNGQPIKPDALMSTFVTHHFQPAVAVLVVFGLLAAGVSTIESLIQSLSTTITVDLLQPLLLREADQHQVVRINRVVIFLLAVVTFFISKQQIEQPNLSVAMLAQNGVYAFFASAFFPVLMGIFGKQKVPSAALASAVTAIVVHFSVYYLRLTPYMQGAVRNPAIPAALAIVSALLVGWVVYRVKSKEAI